MPKIVTNIRYGHSNGHRFTCQKTDGQNFQNLIPFKNVLQCLVSSQTILYHTKMTINSPGAGPINIVKKIWQISKNL